MKFANFLIVFFLLAISCQPEHKINTPLNYVLTGDGTRTLVFLHGWGINQTYWESQVAAFKDRYRILTLDLAGHGQSKVVRTEWTMQNYANDVVDLINQLKLDSVVLIGHSMSGDVNLLVNEKIPSKVIGFIGIDNLQELGTDLPDSAKAQSEMILKMFEDDYVNTVNQFAPSLFSETTDSTVRKRVVNDILNVDHKAAAATLQSVFLTSTMERKLCEKLQVPLMLINSDIHPISEDLLKKHCKKGYRIFQVHGTGHYPMIEAPQEFNDRLNDALKAI
ncbi:alpha/beta hydrolase [bacterium]|nr:alpha/beta hydrolase [bacterium]